MDKNNHTPSSPQPEIDLIALAGHLWKKRRFFIKCCGIATVVGFIIAFSIPKEFTTTVKLAPETTDATNKMGNLGGLAVRPPDRMLCHPTSIPILCTAHLFCWNFSLKR